MASISNQGAANQLAFGQYGSAFSDTNTQTVRPPQGLVIVAVQFLANLGLSTLVAEDPNKVFNDVSSAHSGGDYTRTVNQATGGTTKVKFDDSNADAGAELGDEVFLDTGQSAGVITELDPDGDDPNEIRISINTVIANDATIVFRKPTSRGGEGVGGDTLNALNVFPKGMTIYGRWTEVSLQDASSTSGIICYFGP